MTHWHSGTGPSSPLCPQQKCPHSFELIIPLQVTDHQLADSLTGPGPGPGPLFSFVSTSLTFPCDLVWTQPAPIPPTHPPPFVCVYIANLSSLSEIHSLDLPLLPKSNCQQKATPTPSILKRPLPKNSSFSKILTSKSNLYHFPRPKMASFSSLSLIFLLLLLSAFSIPTQSQKTQITRRNLALNEQELEDQPIPKPKTKKKIEQEEGEEIPKTTKKKKDPTFDSKNQTKPIKLKKSNSTYTLITSTPKSKLNKTLTLKPTNSTKIPKPPKNSTKALNSTKPIIKPIKLNSTKTTTQLKPVKKPKPVNPDSIWLDDPDSDSDLISEFRNLPTRIHEALIPDLKKISITSKAYIYKANKNIAENVKPFVGNKFAPKIATAASCVFLILPLCFVTLLFYHLNSYFSLQHFLIFVQAYLAIYFFTLALTAVVTGLEPLKFFYATSPASYAWTQAVQTLGYLLYLLVQLIHLVVVFSAGENKVGVRALGLAQMIVGLAVGCHYYAAVFHRAVTGDPPRANWRVHGVYAGCFLVICMCARAERRKKAYDGGEDGKKS